MRLVVSCDPEPRTGRAVVWVAHRVDGSADTSRGLDGPRWPTDTFDQAHKGPLGVHASRRRRAAARGTPGWLGCVAAALWHLTGRPAGPNRTNHRIHAMGDACRHHGRAWLPQRWGCIHGRWASGATGTPVVASRLANTRGEDRLDAV